MAYYNGREIECKDLKLENDGKKKNRVRIVKYEQK